MNQHEKLEFLLSTPNILASLMCMFGLAFHANILFSLGFIPFIIINLKRNDKMHARYFIIIWMMAVFGVVAHLMGWDLPGILMEMIS
ncbi:MAG: hypothetical protein PHW97_08815 [Fermentimonas sp.]|jgi:hypothetical protein|nr:hypothetical protein [Fermentimonas sp.]